MLYPLILITLLLLLAGIIAYAGDVLGTEVGKRRLSLFGWRPKRTGQVVGIAAGILIMLTTLAVLTLAFRDARNALLNAQGVNEEIRDLRGQQRELESAVERARQTALSFEEQVKTLETRSLNLSEQNELLAEQNEALQTELGAQIEQITRLNRTIEGLQQELDTRAQELVAAREQVAAVEQEAFTYRQNELIYSALVKARDPAAIRSELASFLALADRETLRRGAGRVRLSAEQLGELVEAAAATPAEDIVSLVSPRNQFRSAQVEVQVEAIENTKLLDKGQLVVSRRIFVAPGTGADALRAELQRLMQDATDKLQRRGLFERERPSFASLSDDAFSSRLQRLEGPLIIGLVAAKDVMKSGPAELELIILQ